MGKLVPILIIAAILWVIFFHKTIPALTRRLGGTLGGLKRAGEEIISDEEVPGSPLAAYEEEAGKAVAAKIIAEHPFSADAPAQERVGRIAARLAAHAARKEVSFRFAVIESAEPNAMAIPGGSIFITRPLLALCGSDDHRIAGVLGHEIAHLDRRHAAKRLLAKGALRQSLRVFSLGRGAVLGHVIGGLELMVNQGYSRDNELEADQVGTQIAAAAGYDPLALARLLADLGRRDPASGLAHLELLGYFKSHPPSAERIRALETYWRRRGPG